MVYVLGTIGFIGGFVLGLAILRVLLKDRSTQELLEDRGLKWTYGLFCWVVAAAGAYSCVTLYNLYFF